MKPSKPKTLPKASQNVLVINGELCLENHLAELKQICPANNDDDDDDDDNNNYYY